MINFEDDLKNKSEKICGSVSTCSQTMVHIEFYGDKIKRKIMYKDYQYS